MPFVADDLGAWLISVLADAGRKKLTTFILGTDQERALRQAAAAAISRVAEEVHPQGGARASELTRIVNHVFSDPMPPVSVDAQTTLLEELQGGISRQLAVLDDPGLTGTGQSSADLLGVSGSDLAEKLTAQLASEIVRNGSSGGPLMPLAGQLNHDLTHLQGRRIENELGRLVTLVLKLLGPGNTGQDAAAAGNQLSIMLSAYGGGKAHAERRLRYEGCHDGGRLVIKPHDPYLDVLRAGGQLACQHYWHSLWEHTFTWPTLDVKVVNNTAQTIFFDQAQFRVSESRADKRPVPVINGIAYLMDEIYLPLTNSGWGPMEDCVFRFHLERPDDSTPLTSEFTWPLDGNGEPIDGGPFIEALAEAGVHISRAGDRRRRLLDIPPDNQIWAVPPYDTSGLGPFTTAKAVASGVLEYTQTELDGSRTRQRNPVIMLFVFGESPVGAPVPPSWTYQVKLQPEGRNYSVTAPISQALAPGEADRFLFKIAADRSSLHHFNLTLGYHGTAQLGCEPVTLELFVPAEYEWLQEMASPDWE
jgi:hypothetical protein